MPTYYERTSVRARRPGCGRSRIEHLPTAGRCVSVCIAVLACAGSEVHQGYQRHRHCCQLRIRRGHHRRWGVVVVSEVHQGYQRHVTTGRRASFRHRPDRPPTPHFPHPLSPAQAAWPLRACPGPSGRFVGQGVSGGRIAIPSVNTTPAGGNPNDPHRGKQVSEFRVGLGAISPLPIPS